MIGVWEERQRQHDAIPWDAEMLEVAHRSHDRRTGDRRVVTDDRASSGAHRADDAAVAGVDASARAHCRDGDVSATLGAQARGEERCEIAPGSPDPDDDERPGSVVVLGEKAPSELAQVIRVLIETAKARRQPDDVLAQPGRKPRRAGPEQLTRARQVIEDLVEGGRRRALEYQVSEGVDGAREDGTDAQQRAGRRTYGGRACKHGCGRPGRACSGDATGGSALSGEVGADTAQREWVGLKVIVDHLADPGSEEVGVKPSGALERRQRERGKPVQAVVEVHHRERLGSRPGRRGGHHRVGRHRSARPAERAGFVAPAAAPDRRAEPRRTRPVTTPDERRKAWRLVGEGAER